MTRLDYSNITPSAPPDILQDVVFDGINDLSRDHPPPVTKCSPNDIVLNDLNNKRTGKNKSKKEVEQITFRFKGSLRLPPKHVQRLKRSLCCLGWIFCCPLFALGMSLRESPMDKEDLQEDDCYPCFAEPTSSEC